MNVRYLNLRALIFCKFLNGSYTFFLFKQSNVEKAESPTKSASKKKKIVSKV